MNVFNVIRIAKMCRSQLDTQTNKTMYGGSTLPKNIEDLETETDRDSPKGVKTESLATHRFKFHFNHNRHPC